MYKCYKYQVMLFESPYTLSNFEGYINKILMKEVEVFIVIYVDNRLIYINKNSHIEFI